MSTNEQINAFYIAAMQSIEGVGSQTVRNLVHIFKTPEKAWNELMKGHDYLMSMGYLPRRSSEYIDKEHIGLTYPEELAEQITKRNIGIVSYVDSSFPPFLTSIYQAPAVLFYKSNNPDILVSNRTIGMVGARACSSYGKNVAHYFSRAFAENGAVIVSGGARGIDTYCHEGALDGNGLTISVMGCGLDRVYPRENEKLFQKIVEQGGALVSEYPIGTKPVAANFPMRNRLISGFSKAVVVVEAKASSGSLITADMAINEGRDVYTIPGNVLSQYSEGSHWLLRQGAIVLTRPSDLLDEYGWNSRNLQKDSSHMERSMVSFTLEENAVLSSLSTERGRMLEDIYEETTLDLAQIHTALIKLEMKHMIEKTTNQTYILLPSGRDCTCL